MRSSLLCLALAACGGGDSLTALEGVYTVSAWTRNDTACDVEGPSVLEINDPNLYIKNESFFGQEFVNVVPCASLGECQADAGDDDTLHLGQWGFQTGSDSAGWTDTSAFAFAIDGNCEATRSETTMTSDGDTIRIEDRSSRGNFAPDAAGECSEEGALAATEGQPCVTLEVVTATFTDGI
jgi:hypothetical protein